VVFTAFVGAVVAGVLYQSAVGAVAAIGIAALLVNGLVATIEDNAPGGFNNPDGRLTSRMSGLIVWGVRILCGIALVGTVYLAWLPI
jgi:hypothetical protein